MDNFFEQGYCVLPNILNSTIINKLNHRFSERTLSGISEESFGDSGAFVVADYQDPLIIKLLTWPKAMASLKKLGFSDPRLHNFYVSTKPPHSEALAWHSDLFYRYNEPRPAELFLIYYLQDTSAHNGCLRVVPGSHKWSHEKRHEQPETSHRRSDEKDVLVRAGDLFIGDRRILHATHENLSGSWRTCITIAYAPDFRLLPEQIQALLVQNRCLPPSGWWKTNDHGIDPKLKDILPIYEGATPPIEITR